MAHAFSLAQCFGYLAFVLGVTAFLQKNDQRLKFFNASESFVYTVHFALLGYPPASASSAISGVRSMLSIKISSPWLAAFFIAANLAMGAALVKSPMGWVPVGGSCVATFAVFTLKGIPMRIGFFVATMCWLVNNIASGSIGGTALETVIAASNLWTMARMAHMASASPRGEKKRVPKLTESRATPTD